MRTTYYNCNGKLIITDEENFWFSGEGVRRPFHDEVWYVLVETCNCSACVYESEDSAAIYVYSGEHQGVYRFSLGLGCCIFLEHQSSKKIETKETLVDTVLHLIGL